MEMTYYLAVDIGASSGRHMLSHLEDGKLVLEEIYRFPNGMTEKNGHKVWDVERLFAEILNGMKQCARLGKNSRTAWGLTPGRWTMSFWMGRGRRIGDAAAYRDGRHRAWMKKCMLISRRKNSTTEQESKNRSLTRSISGCE